MTSYSVDVYSEKNGWESIALFSDKVSENAMIQFCREVGNDPMMGAEDVAIVAINTGEIVWNLESDYPDEEDDWDREMGFDPYEGCYTYDC